MKIKTHKQIKKRKPKQNYKKFKQNYKANKAQKKVLMIKVITVPFSFYDI